MESTTTITTTDDAPPVATDGQGLEGAALSLPDPSGYSTHDEYFATRFRQGGRTVYSLDLSVPQLVATLPEPDPEKVQEGNRRINPPHARAFAEYVRERPNWVCPSLLLRAPDGEFKFDSKKEIGGTELGVLQVPRLSRHALQILDGQHRILGFHMAWTTISDGVQTRREQVTLARRNGPQELIQDAEKHHAKAIALRDRIAAARVAINIVVVDDPEAYRQVFVDIADNAKGVTRTLNARFDRRKVVHRALPLVVEHPLLEGRVEEETDRLSGTNKNLLTAKHIADITHAVQTGGAGRRISKRLEAELEERKVADNAARFLDVMVDAFPDLGAIMEGEKFAPELRRESLLGSSTMIRIFAGVYHELVLADREGKDRLTDGEVTKELGRFASHLAIPVEDSWADTGLFKESRMAPEASQGDMRKLADTIIGWLEDDPEYSESKPAWMSK